MPACPSCGCDNADDARFGSGCGLALASEPPRESDLIADEVLSIHEAKGDLTGRAWAQRRLEQLGVELR